MKSLLIIILVAVAVVSCDEPPSCKSWPEELPALYDCCHLPHHANSVLMNHCFFKCNSNETTLDEQNECASKCYSNYTLLISADGTINKNVVKRIYNTNALFEERWMSIINTSVSECDFEKSEALSQSLAKFYECVNLRLENNCVSFVNTLECDGVQEYYERCNNIRYDCESWPEDMIFPISCCKTPQLFTKQLTYSCRRKCLAEEFFIPRQVKCIEYCLLNETNIKTDGKFNIDVVKNLLIENTRTKPSWQKGIEDATTKCDKKMKEFGGSNTQDDKMNFYFLTCLRDVMSEHCVEFQTDSLCNKVKRFMEQCPDARPNGNRLSQATKFQGGK